MRLFTGIAIAPHVLENLARVLEEMRPLAHANWSPVENLHITSKFIGEWPEERLKELEAALGRPLPINSFDATIARFGYFPNPHRPRALVTGVQAGPELPELASRLDNALEPLGVAREDRPYSPHLTLARIKQGNIGPLREHIAHMTNFDFGTFHVNDFHLYLSKNGPKGSVYTRLATYPFADSNASSKANSSASSRE